MYSNYTDQKKFILVVIKLLVNIFMPFWKNKRRLILFKMQIKINGHKMTFGSTKLYL